MKIPPMPFDTESYLADTTHLTTTENGAYCLILLALWRSQDCSLAGDDVTLSRVTRMTLDKWRRIAPTIRPLLTPLAGNRVTQKRTRKERAQLLGNECRSPGLDSGRAANPLKSRDPDTKPAPAAESPSISLPSTPIGDSTKERKERKRPKAVATTIPPDWRPNESHFVLARELRLSDAQVAQQVDAMRDWSLANAHRPKTWKSDWDATFRNWLRDKRRGPTSGAQNGQTRSIPDAARDLQQRGLDFGPRPTGLPDRSRVPAGGGADVRLISKK